ncbi:MAG: hypothetical protein IPK26_03425 [Planctomycetes bacterium]|nr:hypothetical protein [Planctomycetota bacterium]
MKRNLVLAYAATLTACGGGGGSTGDVNGLQGPEQVTIVESSGSGSQRLGGARRVAGSDYETDQTRFWVHDESMKSLETINMILCSLGQTHYYDQVNAGPYRALVACEERGSGGGESRGDQGTEYEEWTVDCTRANNSAAQVVKFWVNNEDSMAGGPALIYGKLTLEQEPSDAVPLGVFTLVFKSLPAAAAHSATNTVFEGYMRSIARNDGQSEVEFYMGHGDPDGTVGNGDYAMRERVHVIGDPDAETGRAYSEWKMVMDHGFGQQVEQGEYTMQFNAQYLARKDMGGNTVEVFDRADFESHVFRYGVYDAETEERVDRLSGFPVEDADGHHGWVGFHGLWFPGNVEIEDGQTLYRRGYGPNATTTEYTAVIVPGRLEKRTRTSLTLQDVLDEEFDTFSHSAGTEIRIKFDGTDWMKTAERTNGEWTSVTPANANSAFTDNTPVHLWGQRGSMETFWDTTPSTSQAIISWQHEPMTASSPELANGDLTLHGYFHQMRANITSNQANYQNSESPYFPDATAVNSGNKTYVFDRETMMLTLDGDPVRLADGVEITGGPGMFGLNCGPLYATALTDFNEMPNATVTYEWSTGSNPWNQLRTVKNANNEIINFDPPLHFTYVHDEDGSPFDGRSFVLQWDGQHLGGIPHEESQEDNRWYPLINIPTGTVAVDGEDSYKIKQLEGEQLMVAVADPNAVIAAQGFDLDTTISEPTNEFYEDPRIGAKPDLSDAAPLYVAGVAQVQ